MKQSKIEIRIEKNFKEKLKEYAKRENKNLSTLIRDVMEKLINKE